LTAFLPFFIGSPILAGLTYNTPITVPSVVEAIRHCGLDLQSPHTTISLQEPSLAHQKYA
ncbi:MAG: hypothetical protein PHH63_07680, partial [Bacteroidales bacterium]|nr:hypothetical protein [Bacteroidales bacterium]